MQLKDKGRKGAGNKKPFLNRGKKPGKRCFFPKLKSDQRIEAEKIAQRSGISFPDACRVVAGLTTVNDVLMEMMSKERMKKIAAKGIEMSLAGQVARGFLSEKKAMLLSEIKKRQWGDYNSQGLSKFMETGADVAMAVFSRGTLIGKISKITKYSINFIENGNDREEEIHKHDLKFFSDVTAMEKIAGETGINEKIKALNLASSDKKKDRYKPDDATLLEMIKNGGEHLFTMRDGTTLSGVVTFIRRYEFGLRLKNGAEATLFFHSLIAP